MNPRTLVWTAAALSGLAACGHDSPTEPPHPAGLTALSPAQTGVVGTPLSSPVTVRVTDSRGAPMTNVTVRWAPASGSVSAAATTTDPQGIAATGWTLGTVAGAQHLDVSVAGSSITPLHLEATALPGPPTAITIAPSGVALEPLDSVSFTATVAPDRYGNPVTAPVVWTTSDDASAPVTPAGRVSAGRAGRATVSATIGGVTGQAQVTVAAHWQTIGTGNAHSCALDALGYAFCWGDNSLGQLGAPGLAFDSIPHAVSGGRRFAALVVGWSHACGLTAERVAYCWGNNSSAQLGIGRISDPVYTPTAVAGGPYVSLATTAVHTCALDANADAWCWGWEGEGELGNGVSGSFTGRPTPLHVLGGHHFASVAAGGSHTCAVTATGAGYCWGNDYEGQVGDGNTTAGYRTTPVAMTGGLTLARVAAGGSHSCGIDVSGGTWCWGSNTWGQLGDGSFASTATPTAVAAPAPFVALTAGDRHSCALTATGEAFCWGFNGTGQLGDGTNVRKGTPTAVATDLRFTVLSAGYGHSCALTADHRAWCWGDDHIGQLGNAAFGRTLTPAAVAAP